MPQDTELHKASNKGCCRHNSSHAQRTTYQNANCASLTALDAGDLNSIKELVEQGEDLNALGASNRTSLHRAAGANHVDVVKFLLEHGAHLEAADRYNRTPLFWAALGTKLVATL